MRKIFIRVSLIVITATTIIFPGTEANAEECPTYNFQKLFNDEYYPGTQWDNRFGIRDITWSANESVIFDEPLVRSFTPEELTWVRDAFQSWDNALDTAKFTEVPISSGAEINIGYVALTSAGNQPNSFSYWNAWWTDNWRYKATIKLSVSQTSWFTVKNQFIHAVQHEVGDVLGLGDIYPSAEFTSVQEDDWQSPFGEIPLSNFDIGMVRQLYGESTCPSTFFATTSTTTTAPVVSKLTIYCMKGKVTKVVPGVKPKCPRGYKKISKT